MTDDKIEEQIVYEAIVKAREAFENHLRSETIEPAFFPFNIKVYLLSSDFKEVLRVIEDREKDL